MITKSQFRPLWWLRNPHLQTLWPVLTNKESHPGRHERFTLSDGDFLDLAWFDVDEKVDEENAPLVIIVHGLEGSIHSPYAVAITKALQQQGLQTLFMHFRGCSGSPNLRDRSYHSGETGDLSEVIAYAKKVTGKSVYAAIGYSLGGNALLKWLGEQGLRQDGNSLDIERAVAISVPYVLADAAQRMTMGASRIYENYLLTKLRK
ncbi:MAG: alpha/beta fold hydrolase, partial [Thiotrichaceae bacterium]